MCSLVVQYRADTIHYIHPVTFPVFKHRKVLQQNIVRFKDVLHLCRMSNSAKKTLGDGERNLCLYNAVSPEISA